jgi:3-oxoacyl-[acyl-carrier-protein] synthase II
MTSPVSITGAGAVTALGASPELWARVRAGRRAPSGPCDVDVSGLPDPVRGRALRAERVTQLVLAAGGRALEAARLAALDGDPRPGIGTVVGTAFGCLLSNAAHERRLCEAGPAAVSPRVFAATVSNAAAGELAIAYRLGGPAVTLSAGTAAGLIAIGQAADMLGSGRIEALVAGGADAVGDEVVDWLAATHLRRDASPADGAALLVLEPVGAARRRGVEVLGTIEGWASGFDPAGDPSDVVTAALADAGVDAGALACIAGRDGTPALVAHLGDTLAAAGPLGLLAALAEAPRRAPVLVVDACRTGHVAAVVARAGDPA